MAGCAGRDFRRFRYCNRRMERMLPGMELLLDALALVDCTVAQAIDNTDKKTACGAGCFHCCIQPIPVTPLEILGLQLCAAGACSRRARCSGGSLRTVSWSKKQAWSRLPIFAQRALRGLSCTANKLQALPRVRHALRLWRGSHPNTAARCFANRTIVSAGRAAPHASLV